jgi:hypothetical protein
VYTTSLDSKCCRAQRSYHAGKRGSESAAQTVHHISTTIHTPGQVQYCLILNKIGISFISYILNGCCKEIPVPEVGVDDGWRYAFGVVDHGSQSHTTLFSVGNWIESPAGWQRHRNIAFGAMFLIGASIFTFSANREVCLVVFLSPSRHPSYMSFYL